MSNSSSRIAKRSNIPTKTENIQLPPMGGGKPISFSYKYLEVNNRKFEYTSRGKKYFLALTARLRDLSNSTQLDLLVNRSKSLRCHPIKWDDTTESCFGLPNEDQIVDTPYQIQISKKQHGRIHGFFIQNVFYVRWLDPEHNLYN